MCLIGNIDSYLYKPKNIKYIYLISIILYIEYTYIKYRKYINV